MSFFSNNSGIIPGLIEGSPLNGLSHRVAVNVRRVLDSGSKKITKDNIELKLFMQREPKEPYKFISASSTGAWAEVANLRVDRLAERPVFARIRCNVIIPVRVTFADADGEEHNAESKITMPQDVVMYVPEASMFPFEIVAAASVHCTEGRWTEAGMFIVTACMTIITKVIAETDLLIPAYGFCPSPRSIDFREEMCNGFFDLPLYPSGR